MFLGLVSVSWVVCMCPMITRGGGGGGGGFLGKFVVMSELKPMAKFVRFVASLFAGN